MLFWHANAPSQDLLDYFLFGNTQNRMIGGSLFAPAEADNLSVPGGSRSLRPSFTTEYHFDNLYREERGSRVINEATSGSRSFKLAIPWQNDHFTSRMYLNYSRSNFSARMVQDSSDQGNYMSQFDRFTLSYVVRISRLISLGGDMMQLSDGNHSFTNSNGVLTIGANDESYVSLRAGNTGSLNLIQLNITDVQGVLPLHFQKRGFTLSAGTSWNWFVLSTMYDHASLASISDATESGNTRFVPYGSFEKASLDLRAKLGNTSESLLGFSFQTMDGSANFLSSEMSYGKVPSFAFDDYELHGGIRFLSSSGRFITGDIQWRRIRGNLEGHVDTWPFVSIFQSLISTREYFTGNGSLEFAKVHAGALIPASEKISFGIGANYMHLLPSLTVESWQPKYFIFGVRAYKERTINIKSMDLIILSTGIEGELGNFAGSYSITQIAPLRINRATDEEAAASSNSSIAPGTSVSHKISGGQFHQFNLTYTF